MFGVASGDLKDSKIIPISDRVGQYFIRLVIDKNLAKKSDLAEVIFGKKITIEKSAFFDRDEEILCGFLTNQQKEQDIV